MTKVNNKPKFKWKLSSADWEKYSDEVESTIPKEYSRMKINKLERKLRKAMLAAAKKHVGKKKITQNTKPWLTDEIKEAIRNRNVLRKTVSQNREEWIEACRSTADMIASKKKELWTEYVSNITDTTNSTQIWRTIRGMDERRAPSKDNEVLQVGENTYVDDKDKAEEFAKTYKSFAKLPVKKEDRTIRRKNRKHMKRKPTAAEESEQAFTMDEMERVIKEAKNNKAAGEDDIPYEMVKNLGPKAKEMLLHLYNRCWEGEGIPHKWRTAIIKPLLKEGKDPKHTVSYRPISLTSCMGKLLEKIVADRLLFTLESRNLLNDSQAGFRPNRCTTDQVLRLVQHASDQLHAKADNTRILATFFDYEKAYDKVWRDGLIHKMIQLGIPNKFIRYVRHFLSGRKTKVEVNGVRSNTFLLNQGLPQGSSISPLLFLIFINDIDVDLEADTVASLFADDTATWMKDGKIRGSNRTLMQGEIDKILTWAERWKMKVNKGKTKSMVFASSTSDRKWDPEFTAGDTRIDTVDEYKFLGITTDNSLRFSSHTQNTKVKGMKKVNILKCLSTKDWGCSLEQQKSLYLTYIRSGLEYASPSWSPWVSATNTKALQTVQNAALRSVGNLYKTCPEEFLHLETGVEPLSHRYKQNDDITWDRYSRLPETDQRRVLQTTDAPIRLTTRWGWRKTSGDRMNNMILTRETTTPHLPPWKGLDKLTVDAVPLEKPKDEYQPEELKRLSLDKIGSFDTEAVIYTDGSTSGQQEDGGAGVLIMDGNGRSLFEASFPAGKLCSSYTGECVAMLRALEWLQENPMTSLICTDSLSLQSALAQNNWKDRDPWLKEIKQILFTLEEPVTLLWIPSHCDIPGNEKADELAKAGGELEQDQIPVTHKIVKANIKSRKWTVKTQEQKTSMED